MEGGGISVWLWQALALSSVLGWMAASSLFDLTKRARALTQPWVSRRVLADTPAILRLQRTQSKLLDCVFSVVSCMVSVPFYTGFLPIVYWSGHTKLARQMTLLMAFCDYIGNSIKDVVSAPRPSCPPVRRLTATEDEKGNAMEYGLPSSHCLNTICLLGYLWYYFLNHGPKIADTAVVAVMAFLLLLILLVGVGRIYLGMHSLIDVAAGIIIGVTVLALWLRVHGYIDEFVTSGQNVTCFWAGLSFLLCFAYPTPEFPTPSFQYHTAFNGVAFGLVSGIQAASFHRQADKVQSLFSSDSELPVPAFIGRLIVGIPTILTIKLCSKAAAKWLLPVACNTLGIPITSSCYVPSLRGAGFEDKESAVCAEKMVSFWPRKAYDVDTGIKFLQYAGLSWSAVVLVPALFSQLNL